MKQHLKCKIVQFLVLVCFLITSCAYAQNPLPDAGQIENTTPKGGMLNDETQIKPDSDTVTNKVEPAEMVEPSTDQNLPASTVTVTGFDVNPSEILSKEDLNQILNPYIGQTVNIDTLKKIVEQINQMYVRKGYISARAFLPPQTVQNGNIKIKLVEGHVGAILIEGNRWTKQSYIKGKISQRSGELFNLQRLEKDILKFNRDNQIKLRANLKPGKGFGTTDIQLIANDPNPWHITPTFDNTGRETVGVLRGGLAFSADSLFGYRDQFVMGYSRARTTDVAYSSYSFPVGNKGTRIGGTFAFSNIKISRGPFKTFNIEGNSYNYGGYVSHPFINTRRFTFSGDAGINFRQVTTFFDEQALFTTQIRSLTLGLTFEERDKWGRTIVRNAFTNGLDLLGGNARFFKYNGSLTRIHSFGHGVVGIFRGACQLTDDRLPPVEQFQIGGSATVRGYSEGLLIGDNGYLFSGELRFPLPLPKKIGKLSVRDRIRGLIFVDHGGAFPDDGNLSSPHHTNFLTSVGMGLRGSITKYLSGRVDWGFGIGRREFDQPTARLHFGLQANPM